MGCNMKEYENILAGVGVPKHLQDDCMRWAFGDGWQYLMIEDSDTVWNERHGDIFLLLGSDSRIEGLGKIGIAYRGYR